MSIEIIKVLITGANGLLGKYLVETLEQNKIQYLAYNKNELDITDIYSVSNVLHEESPSHIFNCAAYTNVVKAEVDREICYKLNVDGVKNLTSFCNQLGIELIQFSTDFVFDGTTKDGLYKIDDKKTH